jgi:hypothetical protein
MKTVFTIVTSLIIVIMVACSGNKKTEAPKSTDIVHAERVKRGEYLVNAIGCDDCHSPKIVTPQGFEIIPELRLSGHPASAPPIPIDKANLNNGWMLFSDDLTTAVGPWGQSFAANLTSHETGVGNWTEENFIRALRHGKYKGLEHSRDLLPPMPWFVYKNLTDEDLVSILAFLKTTNPVDNLVPSPIPPDQLK